MFRYAASMADGWVRRRHGGRSLSPSLPPDITLVERSQSCFRLRVSCGRIPRLPPGNCCRTATLAISRTRTIRVLTMFFTGNGLALPDDSLQRRARVITPRYLDAIAQLLPVAVVEYGGRRINRRKSGGYG